MSKDDSFVASSVVPEGSYLKNKDEGLRNFKAFGTYVKNITKQDPPNIIRGSILPFTKDKITKEVSLGLPGFIKDPLVGLGTYDKILKGEVDVNSPEAAEAALNASLGVALGGLGLSKRSGNEMGMFMGDKSLTFDKASEQLAKELRDKGFNAQEIWDRTQNRFWKSGTRQEIDDSSMRLRNFRKEGIEDEDYKLYYDIGAEEVKPITRQEIKSLDEFDPFKVYTDTKLGKMIEHPNLFKAYPYLKNTRVIVDPTLKDGRASYNPDTETIRIGLTPSGQVDPQSLLHEIQHSIQTKEGWQSGGNPREFKPKMMLYPDGSLKKVSSFKQYETLAGEWEARISQARGKLTPKERKKMFPDFSADMPSGELNINNPKYNLPIKLPKETK